MSEENKTKTIAEALAEVQRRVNEEKARRVAEMIEEIEDENIEMMEAPSLSGIVSAAKTIAPAAVQTAKNFASNVSKGFKGNVGNVTRNITPTTTKTGATRPVGSTFAKPGAASKAGETVGKAAKVIKDNPKTAASGAVGGAAAGAAISVSAAKKTSEAKPSDSSVKIVNTKPVSPSSSSEPKKQTFGQAFSTARKAAGGPGGKFSFGGKDYSTAAKGEKPVAISKLRNMNPKGPEASSTPSASVSGASMSSTPIAQQKTLTPESGKKKKVSESIIDAFLKLQDDKSGNMFEAAKHLSKKQKDIAKIAGDPNKIDAEDFKALRSKKMEEASVDHLGASTVTKDKKGYVDPSTPKVPYSQLPKPGNKAGEIISKAKDAAGMKEDIQDVTEEKWIQKAISKPGALHKQLHVPAGEKIPAEKLDVAAEKGGKLGKRARLAKTLKSLHKEEVEFSEAEIEFINSVIGTEGDNE